MERGGYNYVRTDCTLSFPAVSSSALLRQCETRTDREPLPKDAAAPAYAIDRDGRMPLEQAAPAQCPDGLLRVKVSQIPQKTVINGCDVAVADDYPISGIRIHRQQRKRQTLRAGHGAADVAAAR